MKLLLKLFGGLIILLLIVLAGVWFYMDTIIKETVERVGPEVTGTEVTLGSAKLSPFSGSGSLTNFVVGNPEGFEAPNAFSLGSIDLQIDPATLQDDVIVIKNLAIVAPEIFYENGDAGDNLKALMQNIEQNTGGAQTEEATEESSKKIIIERFSLSDANISVSHKLLGGEPVMVPMPDLTLLDIGRKTNGATVQEVASQIFEQISKSAVSAVGKSAVLDQAKQQIQDRLKDELGDLEALDGAGEKIDGLLKGFGR